MRKLDLKDSIGIHLSYIKIVGGSGRTLDQKQIGPDIKSMEDYSDTKPV